MLILTSDDLTLWLRLTKKEEDIIQSPFQLMAYYGLFFLLFLFDSNLYFTISAGEPSSHLIFLNLTDDN